ncbi:MAG: hypothetical protein FH748_14270 [Balneolaceae bacterium]|nr:hypothetical protein [Balneolaceae bacterium]
MSKNNKYILALALTIAAICILVFSRPSSQYSLHGEKINTNFEKNNLPEFLKNRGSSDDLVALFFVKTTSCSPCINNTIDYISLLTDTEIPHYLIFVNADSGNVERHMNLIKYDSEYHLFKESGLPLVLRERNNELIFLDMDKNKIVYKVKLISNMVTRLDYKKEIIEEVQLQ